MSAVRAFSIRMGSLCLAVREESFLQRKLGNARKGLENQMSPRIDTAPIAEQPSDSGPASAVWDVLDRCTQDVVVDTAEDARHDLQRMRENGDVHITSAIARLVVDASETDAVAETALPHLCRCSLCRGTLFEILRRCDVDAAHPAWAMLAETEDWARWDALGRHATQDARHLLREHGASIRLHAGRNGLGGAAGRHDGSGEGRCGG